MSKKLASISFLLLFTVVSFAQKTTVAEEVFYAKNRPQKINLLREYRVEDYPTYTIVNSNFNIIGHNAPAPSDKGLVQWALYQATQNIRLSDAYEHWFRNSKEAKDYLLKNKALIDLLESR